MARFVVLLLLLALLIPLMPLRADEDDLAIAEAALAAANERVAAMKAELTARFKEIESDFILLRSEDWAALNAPYLDAVALQAAALVAEPDTDPAPALAKAFKKAGMLSEVANERLAAAAAKTLKAEGAPLPPDAVFAAAVKAVFPQETFEECWESSFLDLPAVARFKEAHDELAAAERRLERLKASSGEKPEVPLGMVLIPRGKFIYGPWTGWTGDLKSEEESKERVDAFFIDVTEVTNESYLEFLRKVEDPEKRKEYLALGFEILEDGTVQGPEGRELWPVRGVDFASALAYAEACGKRLPTEEEWEKAARGEKGLMYPWGNDSDATAANAPEEGSRTPAPVGTYPKDKSPYGAMDMAGNVSEMTSTLYERHPFKGKIKASDSIIYRGGNYSKGMDSTAAGYRWFMPATSKLDEVGFRCVISEKAWKRLSR